MFSFCLPSCIPVTLSIIDTRDSNYIFGTAVKDRTPNVSSPSSNTLTDNLTRRTTPTRKNSREEKQEELLLLTD
ncbi:unnamed protein product [Allacma fusca]|uniref:Uncharacterized protein n=1 Tax=Allacma fusca TaxID=39272 RepID=A0A8J2LL27_9HEXA|nr:unnamed protein product [Allacma fusca]